MFRLILHEHLNLRAYLCFFDEVGEDVAFLNNIL